MVEKQIEFRGITSPRVLEAMRAVPRHKFVPGQYLERSYNDTPLPIGEGQTISQPYMVAWMTELLQLNSDTVVLEIGTGSGYQTAILCYIAGFVYTVEYIPSLAREAEKRLTGLGFDNLEVIVGDGSKGYPEKAPYQAIVVTAGSPDVPPLLVDQLDEGGRIVIPVGSTQLQELILVRKEKDEILTDELGSCVFVPLVGEYGWED